MTSSVAHFVPLCIALKQLHAKKKTNKHILYLQCAIHSESIESFRPDHVKRMLVVHLIKSRYTLIIMLFTH